MTAPRDYNVDGFAPIFGPERPPRRNCGTGDESCQSIAVRGRRLLLVLVLLVFLPVPWVCSAAEDDVPLGAGILKFAEVLPEDDANQLRYFAEALSHDDLEVRRNALEAIRRDNDRRKLFAAALIEPLADAVQVAKTSPDAAALLEVVGEPAIPALASLLEHEERRVRIQAAQVVLEILTEHPWTQSAAFGRPQDHLNVVRAKAVETVLDALEDSGAHQWQVIAQTARHLPKSDRYRAATLLHRKLVSGSHRQMTATWLALLGNEGLASLVVAATDEDTEVRAAALEGLRRYASNEDDRRLRELRALLPVVRDAESDPSGQVVALATQVVANVEQRIARMRAIERFERSWPPGSASAREAWLDSRLRFLGIKSTDSERAIPQLGDLLYGPASKGHDSPEVFGIKQEIAAQALAAFGAPAEEHLLHALQQGEAYVRAEVMDSIGDHYPEFEEAVPLLIRSLASDDKRVRRHAAGALGQMKLTRQEWLPQLEEALAEDLRGIPEAIASYGPVVVVRLIDRIADADDPAGEHATQVFVHLDEPPSDEAIRQLIDLLGSDNEKVLHRARRALEAGWEFTRPHMLEALHSHDDPLVRRWLAWSTMLGNTGFYIRGPVVEAVAAVPALLQALEDPNREVRIAAAQALSTVAPGVARWSETLRAMAPLLAEAALDEQLPAALNPVRPLRVLGKRADGVIPQMVRALQGPGLQEEAELFLVDRGEAAVEALREALRHGADPDTRQILEVIRGIGQPARGAAPELVELTRTGSPDERLFAAHALAEIEAAPEVALATVREALQSREANFLEDRTLDVLVDLVAFHPPATEELASLLTMSRRDFETGLPQWSVSDRHLNALGEAGSNARALAPALQEVALGHNWSGGREAAFRALQKIDPGAASEIASRFYSELENQQKLLRNGDRMEHLGGRWRRGRAPGANLCA